jgi:hypothetical protein
MKESFLQGFHLFLKNQLKISSYKEIADIKEQTKASKAEKQPGENAKSDSKETKVLK